MSERPIRILVIAGSLREASYNGRLARLAGRELRELGAEPVLFAELRHVEPFDEDTEVDGMPPGAASFRDAISEADGVFVATPEYNASIPGQLKNAFDWASRASRPPYNELPASPMFGVPAAVASVSTGQFGGVWARDELIKSLRTQGARAVEEPKVAVPNAATAWSEDERLANDEASERLRALLTALTEQATLVRAARARSAETSVPA